MDFFVELSIYVYMYTININIVGSDNLINHSTGQGYLKQWI